MKDGAQKWYCVIKGVFICQPSLKFASFLGNDVVFSHFSRFLSIVMYFLFYVVFLH